MKKYIIVPKLQTYEVEAESAEDAIVKFAWEFDTDLNNYFEVRPEPYEGILREAKRLQDISRIEDMLAESLDLGPTEYRRGLAEKVYDIHLKNENLTFLEAVAAVVRKK